MNLVLSDREKVERLQVELSKLPQYEPETEHFFWGGMYCRKVFRHAGVLVVGKVHKNEHFYLIVSGRVNIAGEEAGPGTLFLSQPGTKRAVLSLEPTVCMTFHRTDAKTVEEAELELVEEEDSMYLPGNIVKTEVLKMTFWVAGAVVVGGALSANAARKGANSQSDAANYAADLQNQQYQQTREDQMPWMQAGKSALEKLTGLLNSGELTSKFAPKDLQNEPGYQFGLNEGNKNLQNSAAARGMGQSGAALKAAERYGQDYAGTKYNDAFNRFYTEQANTRNPLFQLAGLGANANAQVGQAGMNYANQAGQDIIGGSNAQAAAGVARGNIYGNVLGQLGAYGSRFNWNAPPIVYGSDPFGYNGTQNNPSAYVGP